MKNKSRSTVEEPSTFKPQCQNSERNCGQPNTNKTPEQRKDSYFRQQFDTNEPFFSQPIGRGSSRLSYEKMYSVDKNDHLTFPPKKVAAASSCICVSSCDQSRIVSNSAANGVTRSRSFTSLTVPSHAAETESKLFHDSSVTKHIVPKKRRHFSTASAGGYVGLAFKPSREFFQISSNEAQNSSASDQRNWSQNDDKSSLFNDHVRGKATPIIFQPSPIEKTFNETELFKKSRTWNSTNFHVFSSNPSTQRKLPSRYWIFKNSGTVLVSKPPLQKHRFNLILFGFRCDLVGAVLISFPLEEEARHQRKRPGSNRSLRAKSGWMVAAGRFESVMNRHF